MLRTKAEQRSVEMEQKDNSSLALRGCSAEHPEVIDVADMYLPL